MISKDMDWTVRGTGVSLHVGDQLSSHPRGLGQPQLLDTKVTQQPTTSVMLKVGPDLCAFLLVPFWDEGGTH